MTEAEEKELIKRVEQLESLCTKQNDLAASLLKMVDDVLRVNQKAFKLLGVKMPRNRPKKGGT